MRNILFSLRQSVPSQHSEWEMMGDECNLFNFHGYECLCSMLLLSTCTTLLHGPSILWGPAILLWSVSTQRKQAKKEIELRTGKMAWNENLMLGPLCTMRRGKCLFRYPFIYRMSSVPCTRYVFVLCWCDVRAMRINCFKKKISIASEMPTPTRVRHDINDDTPLF